MGFISLPNFWYKMAPSANPDASVCSLNFALASSGSMMWRAGASFTAFFKFLKAFSSDSSHFQGYFSFPNSVRGAVILA